VPATTTVTVVSGDGESNDASVTVTAIATATLKLAAATVPRPYLLDAATIDLALAGWAEGRLQVRPVGTPAWTTAPDSGGVWGTRAGQIQLAGFAATGGYSALWTSSIQPQLTYRGPDYEFPAAGKSTWLAQLRRRGDPRSAEHMPESAAEPRQSVRRHLHRPAHQLRDQPRDQQAHGHGDNGPRCGRTARTRSR
jgi:hypothetical protein